MPYRIDHNFGQSFLECKKDEDCKCKKLGHVSRCMNRWKDEFGPVSPRYRGYGICSGIFIVELTEKFSMCNEIALCKDFLYAYSCTFDIQLARTYV